MQNFYKLSKDQRYWEPKREWEDYKEWLAAIPDSMIPKIFNMLRSTWPNLLSQDLVKDVCIMLCIMVEMNLNLICSQNFLRGDSVALSNGLGGERPVNKYVLSSIAALGPSLVRLQLTGFDSVPDQTFGAVLKRLPSLQVLNLRYIF